MSKILKFQTKNQKKLEQMQAEQEKACDKFEVLINRAELKANNSKNSEFSAEDVDNFIFQMAELAQRHEEIEIQKEIIKKKKIKKTR